MQKYIAISADIKYSWVYNSDDPCYFKWWFDLFTSAEYRPRQIMMGHRIITIGRHQLIGSVRKLAERWNASRKKVHFFLRSLIGSGLISRKVIHNIPVITILAGYGGEEGVPFVNSAGDSFSEHTSGNTLEESPTVSVPESCTGYLPAESQNREHTGEHLDGHNENTGTVKEEECAKPSESGTSETQKEEGKDFSEASGNTSGNTPGNTYNNKYNINQSTNPAHAREGLPGGTGSVKGNSDDTDWFTDCLKADPGYITARCEEFTLKENELLGFLDEFRDQQRGMAKLPGGNARKDVNKAYANYQNHFRNWLRNRLNGKYKPYRLTGSGNNVNSKSRNNGFYKNPACYDTTHVTIPKDASAFDDWG